LVTTIGPSSLEVVQEGRFFEGDIVGGIDEVVG
jgi:hypothetical protein